MRLVVIIRAGAVAAGAADRGVALTRALRWAAGCLLFAAVYYVAVQGGYAVKLTGAISAVWPPVGLAAGVLYLAGLRWWPGVVIGNLVATDSTLPNVTIVGQTVGNLAEVLLIAILLRRLLGDGCDGRPARSGAADAPRDRSWDRGECAGRQPVAACRRCDPVARGADYVQDVVAG